MRVAFLSDVHANFPALEAALAQATSRGADRVVVAGDVVGDGPHPAETVDLLRRSGCEVVRGNVDREVLEQGDDRERLEALAMNRKDRRTANRAWTALRLELGQRPWLQSTNPRCAFAIAGYRVLVVHGSPADDADPILPDISEEELEAKLVDVAPRPHVVVCGHTHHAFVRYVAGILVVNGGSVGRPTDGNPWGSFGILDLDHDEPPRARIVRFPYRTARVVEDIRARSVPGIDPRGYLTGTSGSRDRDVFDTWGRAAGRRRFHPFALTGDPSAHPGLSTGERGAD